MNLVTLETFNARCFRDEPLPLHELQRWCRSRYLPARKIGGRWFVDLDAFGAGGQAIGPAEWSVYARAEPEAPRSADQRARRVLARLKTRRVAKLTRVK